MIIVAMVEIQPSLRIRLMGQGTSPSVWIRLTCKVAGEYEIQSQHYAGQ